LEPRRDLAIILRSIAYQERHRIVTAITEQHGLVSAIARNAIQSRRFGGTLEIFAAAEWFYTDKPGAELWNLQEARIRRSFEGLRTDFERMSLASAMSELLLRVAPQNQVAPELFKLHSNALAVLDELPRDAQAPVALLNAYLAKLLQWSGHQPSIQACLGCEISLDTVVKSSAQGVRAELTGVVSDAGWVCENCRRSDTRHVRERGDQSFGATNIRLTPLTILDFHSSLGTPIRQCAETAHASNEEHRELFRFLEALLIYHLPGFDKTPIKSLRFLELESNLQPRSTSRP
jgi:DNA repair protein RecO